MDQSGKSRIHFMLINPYEAHNNFGPLVSIFPPSETEEAIELSIPGKPNAIPGSR
jgi:hypothetical protein